MSGGVVSSVIDKGPEGGAIRGEGRSGDGRDDGVRDRDDPGVETTSDVYRGPETYKSANYLEGQTDPI